MSVHQRFKEIMFRLEENGASLGRELDVSKTAILKIANGTSLPSSKILIPLGEKLGVSADWLLFNVGTMFLNGEGFKTSTANTPLPSKGENEKGVLEQKLEIQVQKNELQEQQITLLSKTIEDKDEIIRLLKQQNS